MATFLFEGQHKAKLVQDYRGTNRSENAAALIRKNREDRQKRQTQRLQNEAATTIQSFIRGSLTRSAQKRYTRDLFDDLYKECCSSSPTKGNIMTMMRAVNSFYNPKTDTERLMQLSTLLVTPACRLMLDEWLQHDQSEFRFAIGRFLFFLVSYLSTLAPGCDSRSFAMPLRLLELTFGQAEVAMLGAGALNIGMLLSFLARKGFFPRMAKFIQAQTPPLDRDYDAVAAAKRPREAALLALFVAPLRLVERLRSLEAPVPDLCLDTSGILDGGGTPGVIACEVVRALCASLYSSEPHFGYQPCRKVTALLSAAVADVLTPRALLAALLVLRQPTATKGGPTADALQATQLAVPASAQLLHLVAHHMLERHLARPNGELVAGELCYLFLLLLAHLVPAVLPPLWATAGCSLLSLHEDEDDDDDEEDMMDYDLDDAQPVERRESVRALQKYGADVLRKAFEVFTKSGTEGQVEEEQSLITTAPLVYATCVLFYGLVIRRRASLIRYTSFLHAIGECPGFLARIWSLCLRLVDARGKLLLESYTNPGGLGLLRTEEHNFLTPLICTFACCFHHRLLALHDGEFADPVAVGFPRTELVRMSAVMRDLVLGMIELAHPDTRPELNEDYKKILERLQRREMGERMDEQSSVNSATELIQMGIDFEHVQRLTLQLYHRDRRRRYCPADDHWTRSSVADSIRLDQHSWLRRQMQSKDVPPLKRMPFGYYSVINAQRRIEEEDCPVKLSTREARQVTILTELPFVLPFSQRVRIFYTLVQEDRRSQQGNFDNQHMYQAIRVRVRRSHLYEDSFEKLSKENEPSLRLRLKVEFMNQAGAYEAGVDGGGLSREFLAELLLVCFDPTRGFFVYAEDKTLYPNPEAEFVAEDFRQHYYFMGRMLAKTIYEGLLVELNFANFFLAKVLSRVRGDVDIDYLQYLDPDLYKNLLSLKTYDGDVLDLGLDFSVVNALFGRSTVTELKPGGAAIPVTAENRVEYIHLVAHHKLNRQIRAQVDAFVAGLNDVVPIDWLRMFDAQELQLLISGANTPINLEDLREYTKYVGCSDDAPTIQAFWDVMESMSEDERRQVLKFVTSCSRPPLFGFRELHPPFTIQLTPETDRLPTASTCVNLLKLPDMRDSDRVREKLIYVIASGAGFELS